MINVNHLSKEFLNSLPGQRAVLRHIMCTAWATGKINEATYLLEKNRVNKMLAPELGERTLYYNSLLKSKAA